MSLLRSVMRCGVGANFRAILEALLDHQVDIADLAFIAELKKRH